MDDEIAGKLKQRRASRFGRDFIRNARNRPSSDSKYLSEVPVEYILTGESGSYNEGELEDRINNKVPDIAIRIERLINDLAVLSHGGYLDNTNHQWDDILNIRGHCYQLLEHKTVSTANHSATKFGYDLGIGITEYICDENDTQRGIEFIWGMILSQSATTSGDKTQELENVRNILEELEKRVENTMEDSYSYPGQNADSDAISNFDIASKVPAEDEIVKNLKKYNIVPTPHLVGLYNNLIMNKVYDEDVTIQEATEELVEELVKPLLVKCAKLRSKLVDEWDTIDDAAVPGVDVEEILSVIWENRSNSLTSADIAGGLGGRSKYKNQVTNSLNKLSEQGKDPAERLQTTYEDNELVYRKNGGWTLTSWGDLVCFFVFEKNMDPEWMQESIPNIETQGDLPNRDLSDPSTILERGFKKSMSE